MDITAFPHDIFLLIVEYVWPLDMITNRRVSKAFHAAFRESELNRHVLLQHYPRVRELRNLNDGDEVDWSRLFAQVAARYFHLKAGKPRGVEKLALRRSFVVPKWARYYPVATWQKRLQFEEKVAPFHYPDALWTYDDGILIFPSAKAERYELYDVGNGKMHEIDFEPEGKIVRRIRLKERVFVVEWCEEEPYHQLNENEMVYRHFATAYNIIHREKTGNWDFEFKNEWKIHFLGMPLNSKDRFYSVHTATHYALYLWQPNRSSWGEDDPIEALTIWDISSPSSYRPSLDPMGKGKPQDDDGPQVIKRLSFADLDFYKIRQRSTPRLRTLDLDENHVYIIEEDHRWLVGQQAGHALPRLHRVSSVGIPFADGPYWLDECGARGDGNMSFCERSPCVRTPGTAPCWRHEDYPYLTITEAVDERAGVKFSARHCFMLETISIHMKPKVHIQGPSCEISLRDDLWSELLGKGKIVGDERFLIGENNNSEVVILHFDKELAN